MDKKKVLLVVDNRPASFSQAHEQKCEVNPDFRGSAFKATQIDAGQERQDLVEQESLLLNQLQKRVENLEQKMRKLEQTSSVELFKKKKRRKAAQIAREFKVTCVKIQCPHQQCSKLYGSETSLKNHLKLKHSLKK